MLIALSMCMFKQGTCNFVYVYSVYNFMFDIPISILYIFSRQVKKNSPNASTVFTPIL